MAHNLNLPFFVLTLLFLALFVVQIFSLWTNPRHRRDGYVGAIVWMVVAAIFGIGGVQRDENMAILAGAAASGVAFMSYLSTRAANQYHASRARR